MLSRLTNLTDLYLYNCYWFANQSLDTWPVALEASPDSALWGLESRRVSVREFGSVYV